MVWGNIFLQSPLMRSVSSKIDAFESACLWHAIVCTPYFNPTLHVGLLKMAPFGSVIHGMYSLNYASLLSIE